jgi:hypothetical protein
MNKTDQTNRAAQRHERSAINMRAVAWSGVGLAATIVLALVLMWQLMLYLSASETTLDDAAAEPSVGSTDRSRLPGIAAPTLDPNQPIALRRLREREQEILSQYAWIDQQDGVARIPIDRAIEIISKQGFPRAEANSTLPGGETP